VLDFRKNPSRRSNEPRNEHRHLFVLVLMLGIAFVLIGWVQNPEIRKWLDLTGAHPTGGSSGTFIDNRLDAVPRRQDTAEEAFLMPSGRPSTNTETADSLFPGLTLQEFEVVHDNEPSKHDEQAVSLHLLDILNRTDPQTLKKWSLGPISYAQLFQQPSQYRGRLIDISGTVRRANWLELFPNQYDIKGYYQIWLWPSDNPASPIIIYCLRLPKGFPTGMEITEQVETTGFFFKRCAYQAKDTIRIAPEILTDSLQWQKRPVMNPMDPAETWPIPVVVFSALLIALLAAGIIYLRTRPVQPIVSHQSPDFTSLQETEPREGDLDEHR
jgi:hypothetical protein